MVGRVIEMWVVCVNYKNQNCPRGKRSIALRTRSHCTATCQAAGSVSAGEHLLSENLGDLLCEEVSASLLSVTLPWTHGPHPIRQDAHKLSRDVLQHASGSQPRRLSMQDFFLLPVSVMPCKVLPGLLRLQSQVSGSLYTWSLRQC